MLVSLLFHYELSSYITPGIQHIDDKLYYNASIGILVDVAIGAMGIVPHPMPMP